MSSPIPPQLPDVDLAERTASELAVELLTTAAPVDLRDEIDSTLRTPRGEPATAVGCPCGCAETKLLLRAREGDSAAVAELLERYRALARAKARSYFLLGAGHDDVMQEAMIGVFKAIRDFDPDRGMSFRSFAEMCVTRQILSAVTAANRFKHSPLSGSVSLDEPSRTGDGVALRDLLPAAASADPAASLVSAEELRALQLHIDEVLTDLERQVLRHHVQGKSYDEIAHMLQRHVKAVDNALQRIRRKIQGHLADRATQAHSG